ncbi:hypothetical protein TEA_016753 [Camellia sinensis var. sinensis]|uniref:Uncharacterized protein n=1 Tax=Camellia sinensis var. sinensis TaxID=542762 RepID=A0A4S4EBA0_CAMSN|nr:hypothetical protein TEA_016753 [Camellia sinensis var. sinensis]
MYSSCETLEALATTLHGLICIAPSVDRTTSVDSHSRSSTGVDSHTAVSSSSLENGTATKDYKMASSSSNNSNIRLKPRLCDCGRTAAIHIISEEHCNYFKFADDNDDDVISNATPRKSIRSEEFNDLSTRVYEMDNEFQEHGRRLRRVEKKLNAMLYVIEFYINHLSVLIFKAFCPETL